MNQNRRNFLKAGALLSTGLVTAPLAKAQAQTESFKSAIPKRKVAKSGLEMSILDLGGMMTAHSPRFLEMAYREGIRSFDTAKGYIEGKSELHFNDWFKRTPQRRSDIFLSTKNPPAKGAEFAITADIVKERADRIGVDYVDLVYIHALSEKAGMEKCKEWLTSAKSRKEFDKIKAEGRCKFLGVSVHQPTDDILKIILDSKCIDAVMVMYNPFTMRGTEFDKLLDKCANAGIAIVAMKTMRPLVKKAPKTNPASEKIGLNFAQSILHACWSDERVTAVVTQMENDEQLRNSVQAAIDFKKPLTEDQIKDLAQYSGKVSASICTGCPSCDAIARQYGSDLYDMSRFVSYYENDGNIEARSMYKDAHIDLSKIDLHAAQKNCVHHVDYPSLLEKANDYFC